MGKRKSKKKVMTVKRKSVVKVFDCPFCNHAGSVEAKIDRTKKMNGTVECSVCQAKYSTHVNALTEPIDVYSEWIDKCEEVAAQEASQAPAPRPAQPISSNATAAERKKRRRDAAAAANASRKRKEKAKRPRHDEGEMDDFIVNNEEDDEGEEGYGAMGFDDDDDEKEFDLDEETGL